MRILYERPIVITPYQMSHRTPRAWVDRPRSEGVHVQTINQKLGVAAGKLSDADDIDFPFERMSDESYPLMMALGVGWEEFRASFYSESELLWQPCEAERDGIYGTPDGLWNSELLDSPADWECKRTTKKIQSIAFMWMYLKQGMSYCAMLGLRHVLYDVLFVLGDYTRPYQPVGVTSLVEFEEREIESWWAIIRREALNETK